MSLQSIHEDLVRASRQVRSFIRVSRWIAVPTNRSLTARLLVRLPRMARVGLRRVGFKIPVTEIRLGKTFTARDLLAQVCDGDQRVFCLYGGWERARAQRFLELLRSAYKANETSRLGGRVRIDAISIRALSPAALRLVEEAGKLDTGEPISPPPPLGCPGPEPVWPDELDPNPEGTVLEVRQTLPSGWGVAKRDSDVALFLREDREEAVDDAIEQLAKGNGGEVWVMNLEGQVATRIEVPLALTSRREIIYEASLICERDGLPFPGHLAARWEGSVEDPLFAVALWRVWRDQPSRPSSLVFDMGVAGQYGPYVFWSYYREGPMNVEKCPSVAAAMRRFGELAAQGPNPGVL